jgi:hypothetical protein
LQVILIKDESNCNRKAKDMSINIQEPQGNTLEFQIDWSPATKTLETIKWTISKEKFEINHGLCNHFKLHEIMLHCLTVMHKLDGQVGDSDNKKLQSYKTIMPRTLSIPLAGVWKQVVAEYELDNLDWPPLRKSSRNSLLLIQLKTTDTNWSVSSVMPSSLKE